MDEKMEEFVKEYRADKKQKEEVRNKQKWILSIGSAIIALAIVVEIGRNLLT